MARPINNNFEGPSDLQNLLIQVDVYAKTSPECGSIADQVAALLGDQPTLIGSPLAWSSLQTGGSETYDDDRASYRAILEFSFWRV